MTTITKDQSVQLAREAKKYADQNWEHHGGWPQAEVYYFCTQVYKLARNQALDEAKQAAQQKAATIWEFHPEEVKQAAHNVCTNIANAIESLKDNTP